MKKIFLPLFFAAITLGGVSCSDDDNVSDPAGTVAINMLDESNGKTVLGDSGIYIDKAQNFIGNSNCVLFVSGRSGGLGAVSVKSFDTPASQAAVQPGYGYVAVRPSTLMQFPSGKLALPIVNGVNYLKFYVVSPLSQDDKTVGAAVKYAQGRPARYNLPEYGSTVLTITMSDYEGLGTEVALALPTADCEFDFPDADTYVGCERRGRKLVFWLEDWSRGNYELFLRIGESYTKVYVEVVD